MEAFAINNSQQRKTEYSNLGQMYAFGHNFTFQDPDVIRPYLTEITALQLVELVDKGLIKPVDITRDQLMIFLGLEN